jgi:PhnB protein
MAQVNPYLTFKGNCEEAFDFYKSVFGSEIEFQGKYKYKDMPPMGGQSIPESEGEKIMHVALPISKETMLMGMDSSEALGHSTTIGNNFTISITAESKEEADKLFNGLSEGGKATMPMNNTFWGAYFGMLTDKFGIQWMVSYDQRENK